MLKMFKMFKMFKMLRYARNSVIISIRIKNKVGFTILDKII